MKGGPWRHSSSSSSSGSSSSSESSSESPAADAGDMWRPDPVAAKPKAKGRPRKYPPHVTTKKARKEWLASQNAGAAESAVAVPPSSVDGVSCLIRPVGPPDAQLVARIVAKYASGFELAERIRTTVDSYLGFLPGDTWLGTTSINRAAEQLGVDRAVLRRRLITMGSAVFAGSRALAGSILSTMYRLQEQKKIVIEGVFTNVLYDETPLSIRVNTRPDDAAPVESCYDPLPTTCKLLCMEFEVGILAWVPAQDKFSLTVIALPCPVLGMSSGCGSVLKSCIQAATAVPLLNEIRSTPRPTGDDGLPGELPFSADVSCADRAGSNNTCEDGLYAEAVVDGLRLRFPCVAHISATSTGRGLQTCSKDVSGTIAMCLALDGAGKTKALRNIIIRVLVNSAEVIDAAPLGDGHDSVQYLKELLMLCMPCTESGKDRALLLLSLLTSDAREPFLQLRVVGGLRNFSIQTWATRVAWALLPGGIRLFPRHRWCNSSSTFQAFTLLAGVHDLLFRAGCEWLSGIQASTIFRTPASEHNVWLDDIDIGQLPEPEPEAVQQEHVIVERKENQVVDWAAFNKKQKKTRPLRGCIHDLQIDLLFSRSACRWGFSFCVLWSILPRIVGRLRLLPNHVLRAYILPEY